MAASSMERAIKSVFDRYFPLNEMKSHQMEVISHIMNKKDVFCLLPTGYGKSMTFIMVPLLLNELNPEKKHTAVVISPLKALMADQAEQLRQKGIKTAVLVETTQLNDVKDSDPSIIFASPEAAILPKWTRILREHLQKRICLLAFDEAHCISSWGLDFRPSYRQVAVLQSYFDVPTLVLTATATRMI
ncbi:uncharacterized protein [Argopecten irradians]|uniref:uncharacterized protein n=1 Tax=Argopecten irradians TaxID=31199 RepID=UPI00371A07A0